MIEYRSFNKDEWNESVVSTRSTVILHHMDWDEYSWNTLSSSEIAYIRDIKVKSTFPEIAFEMDDNKVYIISPRDIIINTYNGNDIDEYFVTYSHKDCLMHLLISHTVTDQIMQDNCDRMISTALREEQDIPSIFKFLGI